MNNESVSTRVLRANEARIANEWGMPKRETWVRGEQRDELSTEEWIAEGMGLSLSELKAEEETSG